MGDTYKDTPENPRIFYCWQSDSDGNINRDFINDALLRAKDIVNEKFQEECYGLTSTYPLEVVDAGSFRSGSQLFPVRLQENLSDADIFIVDLSFVAKYPPDSLCERKCQDERNGEKNWKHICNANVMLEMGMAVGLLGRDRVIGVQNTAHGDSKELPSDFQGTEYPIRYKLSKADYEDPEKRDKCKEELIESIKNCIVEVFNNEHLKAKRISGKLDRAELIIMREGFSSYEKNGEYDLSPELVPELFKREDDYRKFHYGLSGVNNLIAKGVLSVRHHFNIGLGRYEYSYRLTSIGKSVRKIIHKDIKRYKASDFFLMTNALFLTSFS